MNKTDDEVNLETQPSSTLKTNKNSLSRGKRTPFVTKNAELIRKAKARKGATGADFTFEEK